VSWGACQRGTLTMLHLHPLLLVDVELLHTSVQGAPRTSVPYQLVHRRLGRRHDRVLCTRHETTKKRGGGGKNPLRVRSKPGRRAPKPPKLQARELRRSWSGEGHGPPHLQPLQPLLQLVARDRGSRGSRGACGGSGGSSSSSGLARLGPGKPPGGGPPKRHRRAHLLG